MGQYYRAVVKIGNKIDNIANYIDGEYVMGKLMEQSWWDEHYVLQVASLLWRTRGKLAWVGDYANAGNLNWNEELSGVWDEKDSARRDLVYNGFTLDGIKFFFNHTKKEFIDLEEYKNIRIRKEKDKYLKTVNKNPDEISLSEYRKLVENKRMYLENPVSILTAVGNGEGGGDYYSGAINAEKVGIWAWDTLEITDETPYEWDPAKRDIRLKDEFCDYKDATKDYIFDEEDIVEK